MIDTGADVTVIPSKFLEGPVVLQNRNRVLEEEIYVVQGLRQALLGRQAVENFKLVTRSLINVLKEKPAREIHAKYPKLFSGLGKLQQSNYTIQMKADATPFSLTTPRRASITVSFPKFVMNYSAWKASGFIKTINQKRVLRRSC